MCSKQGGSSQDAVIASYTRTTFTCVGRSSAGSEAIEKLNPHYTLGPLSKQKMVFFRGNQRVWHENRPTEMSLPAFSGSGDDKGSTAPGDIT